MCAARLVVRHRLQGDGAPPLPPANGNERQQEAPLLQLAHERYTAYRLLLLVLDPAAATTAPPADAEAAAPSAGAASAAPSGSAGTRDGGTCCALAGAKAQLLAAAKRHNQAAAMALEAAEAAVAAAAAAEAASQELSAAGGRMAAGSRSGTWPGAWGSPGGVALPQSFICPIAHQVGRKSPGKACLQPARGEHCLCVMVRYGIVCP